MKKVMIGVLVIIPIIIMLIVGMVTNFVSTQAHIGVEKVVVDKSTCTIHLSDLTINDKGQRIVNLNDYIGVTVLPEKASNKTVTWSIEGEVESMNSSLDLSGEELVTLIDSDVNPVASNTTGMMLVSNYCHFTVAVQAEQAKARCTVEITDADVQSVKIEGKSEISVGESALLTAKYSPIGSLVTEGRWESLNPDVATVDANGVVKGLKAGQTEIVMYAVQSGAGNEIASERFAVTVKAAGSAFGNTVYVAGDAVSLAEAGIDKDNVQSVSGGVRSDDTLNITEAHAEVTLTDGGKVVFVKCASDDFVIENADIFTYDGESANPYIVAINDIPLTLSAAWRADIGAPETAPAVTWRSSNENVAYVDENGFVHAVSEGEVTVSANCNGKVQTLNLLVANKIVMVNLEITNESLKVGLALETIFASQKYDVSYKLVPNTVEFRTLLPTPTGDSSFYNAFTFTVEDEYADKDIAFFNGNVLTFIPENITERTTVTVTVKAKYPRYPDMQNLTEKSVTLDVVSGVQVSTLEELYTAADASLDYEKYTENGSEKYRYRKPVVDAITLVNDIEIKENSFNRRTPEICSDFYGNGNMIYSTKAFIGETGTDMLLQRGDGKVVSNVTLTTNRDIGDEITDVEGAQGLRGYGITFDITPGDRYGLDETRHSNTLEYSIVQNAGTGIGVNGIDLTLEGCIVRNMGGTGVYVPTNLYEYEDNGVKTYGTKYSVITTHNVVMSNLIGTAMSFQYVNFSGKNKEIAEAEVAKGHNSGLAQTGFLDIYNWQPVTALNLIDKNTIDSSLGSLVDIATGALGSALLDPKFSDMVRQYNGETYIHMGFISVGITEKSYLQPQFVTETDRYFEFTTNDLKGNTLFDVAFSTYKPLADNPIRVWCYGADDASITPGKTYVINARFIERLHQD